MSETDIKDIKNLDQPEVQVLINKFKNRHEMNVVEVAEIVAKLITTLKLDKESGRPKELGSISGWHLGKVLGIGKGVVSQYLSVWNMPQESKDFLRGYNISLIDAYQSSREKGKDITETIFLQKKMISEKNIPTPRGTKYKTNILVHTLNQTEMILNGIITSHKIPKEIFKYVIEEDPINKAKTYIYNIEQCVNYLSPILGRLLYLRKEVEFCNLMIENNQTKFCGMEITKECLLKQISSINKEILLAEAEQKLPHIASLLMMKGELEKNV